MSRIALAYAVAVVGHTLTLTKPDGTRYVLDALAATCSCAGFKYRRSCHHKEDASLLVAQQISANQAEWERIVKQVKRGGMSWRDRDELNQQGQELVDANSSLCSVLAMLETADEVAA
jgi:hypothetical protein